jgi:hypothetical protein
MATLS